MKRLLLFLLAITSCGLTAYAQVAANRAIKLKATFQKNPAKVTITWPAISSASAFKVYRKAAGTIGWEGGKPLATLGGTATSYTDTFTVGHAKEYGVEEIVSGTTMAFGYIYAGLEANITENRGKMELLIDADFQKPLSSEITRLEQDLMGDGWIVIPHYIRKKASVDSVRGVIKKDYTTYGSSLKAVFLLGHIAVPYSGGFVYNFFDAPDGHENHSGAWPADVYYADMTDNVWTDATIDNRTDSDVVAKNGYVYDSLRLNIPGDGKFDQIVLPSDLELQIGRVDMHDMPAFKIGEIELIRRYLNHNHAFRNKLFTVRQRALISDNFGWFGGEAFASTAYGAFATMVGDSVYDNINNSIDYRKSLNAGSYVWAYGCGGGTYNSAGGIGSSGDLAGDSLQTVFTALFGSYFGDWNRQDNFLRAPLAAKGYCLASAWSGRPQWLFHHMALGETIGFDTWVSQNDYSDYFRSTVYLQNRLTTVALMGDPSLRMHVVAPASKLHLTATGVQTNKLVWNKSSDNVAGYYVYRMSYGSLNGFTRITNTLVTDTFYTDAAARNGKMQYMVRAVYLQQDPSGSYYNQSQGVMDTITSRPNAGITEYEEAAAINAFPNPSAGRFTISWEGNSSAHSGQLVVSDITGRTVLARTENELNAAHYIQLDLSHQPAGIYTLHMQAGDRHYIGRLVKE